jgi:two-component system chemotaxis response regulator CheB
MNFSAHPIRVLLVDDSPVALLVLKKLLAGSSDIRVVGTASSGEEGLRLVAELNPTIVCTDLHMPRMNGLELTREIMTRFPRPILVISHAVKPEDTQNVLELLEAGAVDVYPKPFDAMDSGYEKHARELASRVRVVAGVRVFTRRNLARRPEASVAAPMGSVEHAPSQAARVVAIGASTGGPQALKAILAALPADFPAPVLCVQHICEGFLHGLTDWLAVHSPMKVKVATAGEVIQPGRIYFPPDRMHLQVDAGSRLRLSHRPEVDGHRPSVTVLFESVAQHFGSAAVGVLLTGMGEDGATGLLAMARAGAVTMAQDEATSVVFGMPKAAIALGAARHVLPLEEVAGKLILLCHTPAFAREKVSV